VSFGFLDADLEVDTEVCTHLATSLPSVPWTFHRALDDTLDPRRTWRRLLQLPGLVNVRSAGSPRGMGEGYDDLLATAESDPAIARLLMPGGGLLAEHVPWLVRAGVRAFHVGPQVRPGGSRKAYVDAGLTRSWRLLLDDATGRI
jgi:copper homeostasis protein